MGEHIFAAQRILKQRIRKVVCIDRGLANDPPPTHGGGIAHLALQEK